MVLCVITLFSCEGNVKNVQQLSVQDYEPVTVGININLKYTDSGRVVTNLIAAKTLDYSTLDFPYREFPQGIELRYWDEENKKSMVTSNYAMQFLTNQLIDLRDNVVVTTTDGTVLLTDQLYWDQQNKWVFTDQPYTIKFKDGSFNEGSGFDGSEDFTTFMSRTNQGMQLIDKNTVETGEN